MLCYRRLLHLALIPAMGLTIASCSTPGGGSDPGTGGTTGGSTTGGRGGSTGGRGGSTGGTTGGTSTTGGTTGGTGVSTGGTTGGTGTGGSTGGTGAGTGGTAGAGTGGSTGGADGSSTDGAAGETGTGGTGGAGGSTGGTGGTGTPGACDYTPKASAMSRSLRFERVNLANWPAGNNNRPYGGGVTEVKFIPGTMDEVFITRKAGQVLHYKISGTSATLVASMTLSAQAVNNREDCGLIGMAFDPDYATNKFVYFGHCVGSAGRDSRLMRYTHQGNMLTDGQQILAIAGGGGSNNSWHSVGSVGFDKNKNIWMLHGEFVTGAPAQNPSSLLGKLLRVQPSRQAGMGGFMPAQGNPNNNAMYALGLRSPWRGSYHPGKDWYFVAEVGPDPSAWEEVNVVTRAGLNLGWPGGTCNTGSVACWAAGMRTNKLTDTAGLPDDDVGRAGRSAWVGPPYGDCGNDRYAGTLTGVVLAGDFFKGWVIGMTFDDSGAKVRDKSLGHFTMLSAVTQGPDGYLYITKFGKYHQGAEEENVASQGLYRIQLM